MISNEVWHENPEAGVSSKTSKLLSNVVRGLLSVSKSHGNVAIWRGSSLSPDNNGSSWEGSELTGRDVVLGVLSTSSELIGSHVSGISIKESSTDGIDGIGNSRVASSHGVSGSGDLLSLVGKLLSVVGWSDKVLES